MSLAKSALVAAPKSPVERAVPRSSQRSTAIPWRVRWSEITRNGWWPTRLSSRSWAPEPVIITTPGKGPLPAGVVTEQAITTPGTVGTLTSSSL